MFGLKWALSNAMSENSTLHIVLKGINTLTGKVAIKNVFA